MAAVSVGVARGAKTEVKNESRKNTVKKTDEGAGRAPNASVPITQTVSLVSASRASLNLISF